MGFDTFLGSAHRNARFLDKEDSIGWFIWFLLHYEEAWHVFLRQTACQGVPRDCSGDGAPGAGGLKNFRRKAHGKNENFHYINFY